METPKGIMGAVIILIILAVILMAPSLLALFH